MDEEISSMFHKEENQEINLFFLYSIQKNIKYYKKEVHTLETNNKLSLEELKTKILENRIEEGRRYNVNDIYVFSLDEDMDQLNDYKEKDFLCCKKLSEVSFPSSVNYFKHHNSVYIFLSSEPKKTKRNLNEISTRKKTFKSY